VTSLRNKDPVRTIVVVTSSQAKSSSLPSAGRETPSVSLTAWFYPADRQQRLELQSSWWRSSSKDCRVGTISPDGISPSLPSTGRRTPVSHGG